MSTIIHRTRLSTWAALAVVVALLAAALAAPTATAAPKDKQPMIDFATGEAITGTFSKVDRGDDAVATSIRTAVTPGHAFTYWYVIFNAPDNCSADCGEDDIFIGGNPANGFNLAGINAARISVVYGGDGDVANPAGRLALNGGLAEGQVPTGNGITVVIGELADGALVPSPVTGLEDAQGAELHIVLQDHGTAHADQDLLDAQLGGFHGACNPDCVDVQFAVHKG